MASRIFSAFSAHPMAAHAAGEVAGKLIEQTPEPPELLLLFIGSAHRRDLTDIVQAISALTEPTAVVGVLSEGIIANEFEVETGLGISAFALHGAKVGISLIDRRDYEDPDFDPTAVIFLADPFSCEADAVLLSLNERFPDAVVNGGFLNAARTHKNNKIVVDSYVRDSGGVLIFIDRAVSSMTARGDDVTGEGQLATVLAQHQVIEGALAFICDRRRAHGFGTAPYVLDDDPDPDHFTRHVAGCFVSEAFGPGESSSERVRDAASVLLFY